MDSARFDTLTRSFSEGMTRRGLTRLVGGLTLGLLHPIVVEAKKHGHAKTGDHGKHGGKGKGTRKTRKHGHKKGETGTGKTGLLDTTRESTTDAPESARAVTASATIDPCRPPGDPCSRDRQCCSRKCSGTGVCRCTEANPCPGSKTCQNGQCVCPDGTKDCSTGCVDTQINPAHCGTCGVACDGGAGTCKNGVCATPEVCDGDDNDFDGQIDEGELCLANKVCQDGKCVCTAGTQDCDGAGNCESLDTDQYCGSCNTPCTEGKVCQGGACGCPVDTKECSGQCVPTSSLCGGVCDNLCGTGQECCGSTCTTLGTDTSCAACNDACGADQFCDHGNCVTTTMCGDGVCNGSETCSTCPEDCGQCSGTECTTDADCVQRPCCHPSYCVPAAQAPACDGIACDAGCQEWTLDCGQGYCTCQSGMCGAVYTGP